MSQYPRWSKAVAAAAALFVVAIIFAYFWFAKPMADDFCRSLQRTGSLFGDLQRYYFQKTGRWASHAIQLSLMGHIDIMRHYTAALAMLWLVHLAGFYGFVRGLYGDRLTRRFALTVALLLALVFFSGMPSPKDGLFWLNGLIEYQTGLAMILLLFWLLMRAPARWWKPAAVFTLAFVTSGMQELTTGALLVLLVGGSLWSSPSQRTTWRIATAAALIGATVLLLAPGNYVRLDKFPEGGQVTTTIRVAMMQAAWHLPSWIADANLIAATLIALLDPRLRTLRETWTSHRPAWLWIVGCGWIGLIAIGFLMPSYALGSPMPGRVMSWIYMVFLVGWFPVVSMLVERSRVSEVLGNPRLRFVPVGALILLSIGIAGQGNSRIAARDLIFQVPRWHSAVLERYEFLNRAARDGVRDIEAPAMPPYPELYFRWDASRCEARYFGVASIRRASSQ